MLGLTIEDPTDIVLIEQRMSFSTISSIALTRIQSAKTI